MDIETLRCMRIDRCSEILALFDKISPLLGGEQSFDILTVCLFIVAKCYGLENGDFEIFQLYVYNFLIKSIKQESMMEELKDMN